MVKCALPTAKLTDISSSQILKIYNRKLVFLTIAKFTASHNMTEFVCIIDGNVETLGLRGGREFEFSNDTIHAFQAFLRCEISHDAKQWDVRILHLVTIDYQTKLSDPAS